MKKIVLGLSYLTWSIVNLAIIFGIGKGVFKLIDSKSLTDFVINLSMGMIMILLLTILSILCLGLISMFFGDEKVEKKVTKIFPAIMDL
jgi:hypothetical protein